VRWEWIVLTQTNPRDAVPTHQGVPRADAKPDDVADLLGASRAPETPHTFFLVSPLRPSSHSERSPLP
jgi:hypothetical protein